MKFPVPVLLLAFGSASLSAKPPENYPPSRYIDLYRNSPFTDPPPPDIPPEGPNDLADWTLAGVRKTVDTVVVTVLNTKSRERITIPSVEATELGFAIQEVNQQRNFLNSTVKLTKGSQKGEVGFDPKFLILRAVAAPPPQAAPQPAANPGNGKKNDKAPPTPGNTPPIPGSNPATAVPTSTTVTTPTAKPKAASTRKSGSGRTRYVPRPKK